MYIISIDIIHTCVFDLMMGRLGARTGSVIRNEELVMPAVVPNFPGCGRPKPMIKRRGLDVKS